MKKLFCLLAAFAASQAMAAEQGARVQKLVTLQYADPVAVQNMIQVIAPVKINWDTQLRMLAIDAPADRWTAVEDALRQLDVPSAARRNIELTVWFITGSDKPSGRPVPDELSATVRELQTEFGFKSYGLLDALALRARSGQSADASGSLAPYGSPPAVAQVKFKSSRVSPDGKTVQLDRLNAGLRLPYQDGTKGSVAFLDTGISTDVEIPAGKRVMAGMTSAEGPDRVVFVIVMANLL